jgi:hypothetical protein
VTSAGSAGGGSSQLAPTVGAGAVLPLMRPFPVVRIAGRFSRSATVVTLATVRAPRGARIAVRCRGRGCPARPRAMTSRLLALGFLRRAYRPGATIEVRVTQAGAIGKYVRIVMRSGKPPARKDLCVRPAGGAPFPCPGG